MFGKHTLKVFTNPFLQARLCEHECYSVRSISFVSTIAQLPDEACNISKKISLYVSVFTPVAQYARRKDHKFGVLCSSGTLPKWDYHDSRTEWDSRDSRHFKLFFSVTFAKLIFFETEWICKTQVQFSWQPWPVSNQGPFASKWIALNINLPMLNIHNVK